MRFQKRAPNWKRIRPNSLREAYRLCKEHARIAKNLSVERIADLMGCSPDALYKWLSNGKMPSNYIPTYEHICGIHFVTEYLVASSGRIAIKIPNGRRATDMEISELQAVSNEAIAKLIRFYKGEADSEETLSALTHLLEGVATHRANVEKSSQPELALLHGDGIE